MPAERIAWFGRTADLFTAGRGHAEVRRTADGWMARVERRIAGPFSCWDAATDWAGDRLRREPEDGAA
jgi:hypothetical protein